MRSAGIKTGRVESRALPKHILLNGLIEVPPQNLVSVSMPLGGYLKSSHLLPGMQVKKGEALAIMEDQQYIQLQQDYLMAKAKLRFIEAEYNRQKELNQSKSSSDKVLQQTEMEYTQTKLNLSALAEKLRIINIRPEALTEEGVSATIPLISPINGFVSKVNVNLGKYVNPTDVLFELIDPSDIHLKLKVFEKDLELLQIGQTVKAFTNNQPTKKYSCEIIVIGRDLSPDRSAEVHCHFKEYDKNLVPGMYMNAEIELLAKQALSLPDQAVLHYQAGDYVFVAKGPRVYEMKEVKTGLSKGGYTELSPVSGENMSQWDVVVEGAYTLLMQLKNRPDEE